MKTLLSILLIFSFGIQSAWAQCAMCKASAETSLEASSQAVGINAGVFYVLVFAFLALGFFGFLFYKGLKSSDLE